MTDEIAVRDADPIAMFELGQRQAKLYAESGYWPDAKSIARAFVKLEAGRALGLNPIVAMTEVHVINEKPTLGVGALSSLVKASGRYDYRVVELTNDKCVIRFLEQGQPIGESTFTLEDVKAAGLDKRNPTYHQYPRNMLFARAMSNGVAWYCPDVTSGRVYVPEDFEPDDNDDETELYVSPIDQTDEYEAQSDLMESADDPPPMSPGGLRLPAGTPAADATAAGPNR